MAALRIKLPARLEHFVATQVKQGTYPSREAVIVAAVENERRRAKRQAALTDAIRKGLDSASTGELNIEDVIRRGRARLTASKRRARSTRTPT